MIGLRTSILDEVRRLAETSRSDFEVTKQRQQEIEKQLTQAVSLSRTTNSAELTMRELETNAKGYRSLATRASFRGIWDQFSRVVSHIRGAGDLARLAPPR